jgi:hypothetical protein
MVRRLIAAAAIALAACLPAAAMTTIPLYLDELVDGAAVAFEGTCIDNRVERDPETDLVVTYTTFTVRELLKGEANFTHVIKQVGGTLDDGKPSWAVRGVPRFALGQDYVLFLYGKSSAGFSSPVGLSQGRFVVHARDGGLRVANGRDFRDLTANARERQDETTQRVQRSKSPVRDLGLDEFKQLVRQRGGGR